MLFVTQNNHEASPTVEMKKIYAFVIKNNDAYQYTLKNILLHI